MSLMDAFNGGNSNKSAYQTYFCAEKALKVPDGRISIQI